MNWEKMYLRDIADIKTGPFGSQLHNEDYVAVGTPIVTVEHLGQRSFSTQNLPMVGAKDVERLNAYVMQSGDIIFSRVGAVDRCSLALDDNAGWLFSGRCLRVRAQQDTVDSEYLYYFLEQESVKSFIRSIAVGATMPSINTKILGEVEVAYPDKRVQKAIAEVLGALDDKIANNESVIHQLDQSREMIWIKAKSRGCGKLPLTAVAHFVNGGAYTKGASGAGRVVVRIAELNSGIGNNTVWNDLAVAEEKTAFPGDLLFAWSGSLTVSRWKYSEAIVNQHIFKVIPNNDLPLWAIDCALRDQLELYKSIAAGKATTMGHIKRSDLELPAEIPTLTEAELDVGLALWNLAVAKEKENQVLARTRDELLPLLMSGKITVAEAEEAVAGGVGVGEREEE